jgi:hypothetical protein
MDLTFCPLCQKVFVILPVHDFGGEVEWNLDNQEESCLEHQTERLIIDFSHFSSDGKVEGLCKVTIFLASGQTSGEKFLIKRSRTRLDMPAEYEIIARGKQAVNAYKSAALKLRGDSENDFRE